MIDYLGPHWCPKSCKFHWWWEWHDGRTHITGVTIFGAAWYWGHGLGSERRKRHPSDL